MLKKLSGLSDEKLDYYLQRVREIAGLDAIPALIEVDKFVWEIQEEHDLEIDKEEEFDEELSYEIEDYTNDVENLKNETKELKRDIKLKKHIYIWTVQNLRESIEELEVQNPNWMTPEIKDLTVSVLSEAKIVADEAEGVATIQELESEKRRHMIEVKDSSKRPVYNLMTVQSIISKCDAAIEFFSEKNIAMDDIQPLADKAKKRAALFRYQKKMNDAEALTAKGSFQKAAGARHEALVLLRQDWELAFPGEQPPEEFLGSG